MEYRYDIDGLRAIAVISVILFHLGFLDNGYLGVDVFFVISGYLITSIIYKELLEDSFSFKRFYERRIRRIIPLLLFVVTIALLIGVFIMLPDDLENLAQSVVASNFSANNILMLITSSDYWAVTNDYKPLMHTWSLGIEEQFYFVYPPLIILVGFFSKKLIKTLLCFFVFTSLFLFVYNDNIPSNFYLLQYRFFELASGGLMAILTYNKISTTSKLNYVFYISFFTLILLLIIPSNSNKILIVATTIVTNLFLSIGKFIYKENEFSINFLQNKHIVYLGKISFSLYLWHQVVFAYSRYILFDKIDVWNFWPLLILTFALSIFTYHFIENPFRNKNFISTRKVLLILSFIFVLTTVSSLYLYIIGGVIKDYPSLDLYKKEMNNSFNLFSRANNIHIQYNEDVRKLDKSFNNLEDKKQVLVIGDSFGRDVVNIFLEGSFKNYIELSYFYIGNLGKDKSLRDRMNKADIIILAASNFIAQSRIPYLKENLPKLTCFGVKNFGYNNGLHYNKINKVIDYSNYFTNLRDGTLEIESKLKKEWEGRYVSMLDPIINQYGQVRVFTSDGKFISQDTEHLTKNGARFYAQLLEQEIKGLLIK